MEGSQFPPEVLAKILDHLPEISDLLSTCQAARPFREPFQKRIFRFVNLDAVSLRGHIDEKRKLFIKSVQSSSHLAVSVMRINLCLICIPYADSIVLSLFTKVLPIMVRLETIAIASWSQVAWAIPEPGIWFDTSTFPMFPSVHFLRPSSFTPSDYQTFSPSFRRSVPYPRRTGLNKASTQILTCQGYATLACQFHLPRDHQANPRRRSSFSRQSHNS
jgi:hypothetical protein